MAEKSREELFRELAAKGVLKEGQALPDDILYTPPQGRVLENKEANAELLTYEPTLPTPQTDLLQDCERQFILPMVMPLAIIFRVPPITDDIYRFATESMKDSSLFCIISRSAVRKLENGYLYWYPFVTVIKRKLVARVGCLFHPQTKDFRIVEIWLWNNRTASYYVIKDTRLNPMVLPGVFDRYVQMEGIFRPVA